MNCPVRPECLDRGKFSKGEGIWGGKFLDRGRVK